MPTATLVQPIADATTPTQASVTDVSSNPATPEHDMSQDELLKHFGQVAITGANQPNMAELATKAEQFNDANQAKRAERANNSREGWKLHLNFDPKKQEDVKKIRELLSELKLSEDIHFRFFDSEGLAEDDMGMAATLYVGSLAKSIQVARQIEASVAMALLPVEPSVLQHDLPFTPKGLVWGRFSVQQTQPFLKENPNRFVGPGPDGVPTTRAQTDDTSLTSAEVINESAAALSSLYGEFFDGNGQYQLLLARKAQLLAQAN